MRGPLGHKWRSSQGTWIEIRSGFCQAKGAAGPFAMDRFPLLLLEEEVRLNDMPLRENW
jgi:hypothetical protein